MGRWYSDARGRWSYDAHAPSDPDPEALHGDEPFAGDVGDWIDPNAPDPTPAEVADPAHPDYVQPWRPA